MESLNLPSGVDGKIGKQLSPEDILIKRNVEETSKIKERIEFWFFVFYPVGLYFLLNANSSLKKYNNKVGIIYKLFWMLFGLFIFWIEIIYAKVTFFR